jgi:glucose/mannose-6-phosphate isomerase
VTAPSTGQPVTCGGDPMLATVEDTPAQWAHALEIARGAPLPTRRPRAVVVAGMGGSGVAGDVAALVAAERSRVPVMAVHGDSLPAFVGPEDLVVLVSHSGTTEESLACARQARQRGAAMVAVTSGGPLAALVSEAGQSVVHVPDGAPPRASMALLSVPVLGVLQATGVVEGALESCNDVPQRLADLLRIWKVPDGDGEPRHLARSLGPRSPVFLGVGAVGSVVATRARNQVAENAERTALAAELPEADHNQLVGWAGSGTQGTCDLVLLRPAREEPATERRVTATIDLARPGFREVHEHRMVEGDVLEQVAAGFLFVDLLSVHLALLAGVDPTPIRAIDELKRRL